MNKLHIVITALVLLIVVTLLPTLAHTHPGGGMMHENMDDDAMMGYGKRRGHMFEGGWGPGNRGGAYPGMHMMGPMMHGNMMGGPMAGGFMGMLSGLDLSDSQRKKVRDIIRGMRKQHIKLMEKMLEATDALADTYEQDPVDTDKIGAAYDKVYKIKRNMIIQHVKTRNKVMTLLTDQQKKKLKDRRPFYGHTMMP